MRSCSLHVSGCWDVFIFLILDFADPKDNTLSRGFASILYTQTSPRERNFIGQLFHQMKNPDSKNISPSFPLDSAT